MERRNSLLAGKDRNCLRNAQPSAEATWSMGDKEISPPKKNPPTTHISTVTWMDSDGMRNTDKQIIFKHFWKQNWEKDKEQILEKKRKEKK